MGSFGQRRQESFRAVVPDAMSCDHEGHGDHTGNPRVHRRRATAQQPLVCLGRGLHFPAEADIMEKHILAPDSQESPERRTPPAYRPSVNC